MPTQIWEAAVVLVGGLVVTVVLVLVAPLLIRTMRRGSKVAKVLAKGVPAKARIDHVDWSARPMVQVQNMLIVRFDLEVHRSGVAPYQVTIKQPMPNWRWATAVAGRWVTVGVDRGDPDTVVIDFDAPVLSEEPTGPVTGESAVPLAGKAPSAWARSGSRSGGVPGMARVLYLHDTGVKSTRSSTSGIFDEKPHIRIDVEVHPEGAAAYGVATTVVMNNHLESVIVPGSWVGVWVSPANPQKIEIDLAGGVVER